MGPINDDFEDEEMEVMEVFEQKALFCNERVSTDMLPNGLYKYDIRHDDNGNFVAVEKSVLVNHGGTILVKAPLHFGEKDYIEFNEDDSPNFLGCTMSIKEFMNTDFMYKI